MSVLGVSEGGFGVIWSHFRLFRAALGAISEGLDLFGPTCLKNV